MVVSLVALFVALGGTGYAAIKLPKNSVGSPQVINGSLQTTDLSRKARTALKGNRGRTGSAGKQGLAGPQGVAGPQGATGPAGPAGASGPQGASGAQGARGTARAYAHVTRGPAGAVTLDTTRSFGVTAAQLPSTGNTDRPCVVLDPSIDATKEAAVVTVDSQNTPTFWTAVATHRVGGESSQGCPANSIAVFVRRNDGSGGDDIAFNVVVP